MEIGATVTALAHQLQDLHKPFADLICILGIPLLPLLLLWFQDDRPSLRARRVAGGVIVLYAAVYVTIMASGVAHPPEWDFPISWFNGYVAAQGLNFYDPENYRRLAGALPLTPALIRFVISVGFHFPPPTIFLFLPLGFLGIKTAFVLWYAVMIGVIALDVVLLARLFLGDTASGRLLAAALLLLLRPAMATVWFGQTNFLIVLMLLLFWRDRARFRGGAWIAFGLLIKPVVAVLLLYAAIARRWRAVVGTGVVLAALSALTIAVFGWDTFAAYFGHNPVVRMPAEAYTETINQSLLATILRLTDYDFSHGSPLLDPLFVVLAGGLGAATAWLAHRAWTSGDDDLALAITIPFGLLVYPGTLAHYSVDLIVPFLLLWARRHALPGGVAGVVAFLTAEYALINASVELAIVGNTVAWLGVAALQVARQRGPESAARAVGAGPPAAHPSL